MSLYEPVCVPQEAATGDALSAAGGIAIVLRPFTTSHELWLGRIAMLGFLGLVVAEGVLGRAFF